MYNTYIPLRDQLTDLTIFNICYVILTTYLHAWAFIEMFQKLFITDMDMEIDSRYGK